MRTEYRTSTPYLLGTFLALLFVLGSVSRTDAIPLMPDVETNLERIRIPFIENCGQLDESIQFYATVIGGTAFVTVDGDIVYALERSLHNKPSVANGEGRSASVIPGTSSSGSVPSNKPKSVRLSLRERLIGARVGTVAGVEPMAASVNHFKGDDPSLWRSNLVSYHSVSFGEVYDGIKLSLRAYGNNVEKIFEVQPKIDPGLIRVDLEGADSLRISATGELDAFTGPGVVSFTAPVAYQMINGEQTNVEVAYALHDNGYGFSLGDYDDSKPLIIDPLLASTYLGGSSSEGWQYDGAIDAVLDHDNNLVIAAMTSSLDFPKTEGVYDCSSCGSSDIFLAKIDLNLGTLLASAVIGGGIGEQDPSLLIDADNNIYLTGQSNSYNYPTTDGAYRNTRHGTGDLFISHFSSDLSTLMSSTFFGGDEVELNPQIAIDDNGKVFISGITAEFGFPTTPGAFRPWFGGGPNDMFVARFDADLTTLEASTFIGGWAAEEWPNMVLDPQGNVLICGATQSDDYPTTAGAYDETFNGPLLWTDDNQDVVISKLSNDLSTLIASTYVGTDRFEGGQCLAVDADGNVFYGGHTFAVDYPTTDGAYDEVHNGENEYFVTKLNADLSTILASTYLTPNKVGTAGFAYVTDMTTDARGNLVLCGSAWNDEFVTTPNAYDTTFNGGSNDMFLLVLDGDLTAAKYATYFGGSGEDGDCAAAIGSDGIVYVAGISSSTDLPITPGTLGQTYNGGSKDVFVAKFQTSGSCCVGSGMGNIDCTGIVDIGDVTVMISNMFITFNDFCCEDEADLDTSGLVDIGDLTILISSLFITYQPFAPCP